MTNYKTKLNYYWLAGLIDGDGYFYLNKANYGCFELTVASADRPMLEDIRKEFNGRIKPRAGTASVRLRVHNKVGLVALLRAVNGRLLNSVRQKQFETVALAYAVNVKPTKVSGPDQRIPTQWQNHEDFGVLSLWFSVQFLGISLAGALPQSLSVCSVANSCTCLLRRKK